mmetsp:Transcript_26019/g.60629  ORF Transcript_26019/g.60629 Transcript_26019/m.60629 type:complete len:258 (-) Transcript_26019:62-835(-)
MRLFLVPFTLATAARPRWSFNASGGDRVAVVNNFAHRWNLAWLSSLRVNEVGLQGPRDISESRPWLQWITEHYDALPKVTIFLHGHQSAWHHLSPVSVAYLREHTPDDVTMLADRNCVWSTDLPLRVGRELPGLNALYRGFWDIEFREAFSRFHMAYHYVCCSENMVTRRAIRRFGKPVYQEMVKMIDENPAEPWGWILERTWQNLWHEPTVKSDAQIIATLNEQSAAMRAAGHHRGHSYLEIQEILQAATACGDPM